ncbi:hypothetical protein NDK43_21965 [Neobacillus pocheonensis]|uniref:Uncharacterized protein n=1 Tax=Neobacillus pocheonensis TaxID=363869 RepID=A0ABT0WFY5_9BACI|nr:hypothetical protein [Neobacillus pocheonensis]
MDVRLKAKGAFHEIISEGNYSQIFIWLDGEWAVVHSPLYRAKAREEKPIYILNEKYDLNSEDFEDSLEILFKQIDDLLESNLESN